MEWNDRNVTQGCCPIKILEYLAAGRVVVAPRIPAVQELVSHGETGWLYKPGKPRRLAAALDELAADPALAERLAAAGQQRQRARFTWFHHNQQLINTYESLFGASASVGSRVGAPPPPSTIDLA